MATIATHNRSSVSRGHNLRKEEIVSKESHIDPNGIHETWVDEAPRQAYERIFGQAVKDYNAKQGRADRQIKDYYNHVRDDAKKHCTYEMIIGVYPADGETVTKKQGRAVMRKFVDGWKERNPNLELIGAYYHADEQGKAPHVHIDYIPVAHGYKNGLEVQNAIVKALGEQGFHKQGKATAQILWEKRENECLEALCRDRGISVEHPQEGKGVKHLHTETYKAEQDLKKASQAALKARNDVKVLQQQKKALQGQIEGLQRDIMIAKQVKDVPHSKAMMSDKLLVAPSDFEALCRTAATAEGLLKEIKPARKINARAKEILQGAQEQGAEILKKAQEKANSLSERMESIKYRKKLEHIEDVINSSPQLIKDYQRAEKDLQARQRAHHAERGFER